MEIAGLIIGVVGLIIAYITFKNTYIKEPKEDLTYLIDQFNFAERSTLELISAIEVYASENNCYQIELMQGLSFQQSITFLKNAHAVLFTEANKTGLAKASLGKMETTGLSKRIEAHINGIQDIKTHLNFHFKKDFSAGLIQ